MPRITKQELLLQIEELRNDLSLVEDKLEIAELEIKQRKESELQVIKGLSHWQNRAQRAEKHVVNLLEQIERSAKH